MRKEGLPIEGFCVAAGIPSTKKAAEIIEGLASADVMLVVLVKAQRLLVDSKVCPIMFFPTCVT